VTQKPSNPWKRIAMILALLLAAVVIALAFIASGVMQLGLSLL
jgi:hypothetical protein